jgi:coenzyme PQQ precursor peptide PqqA
MTEIKAVLSNDLVYKINFINLRRNTMWTTPSATEMRFGFEITLYVMNR